LTRRNSGKESGSIIAELLKPVYCVASSNTTSGHQTVPGNEKQLIGVLRSVTLRTAENSEDAIAPARD